MKKIKEFSKSYLIGFIIGIVAYSTVNVIAATYFPSNQTTYDNSESGLKSENVQDAIDELYGVCFPPMGSDTIKDLLPSNQDELYEDENGDIRYYGKNPNNYVSFNNELWRIIGVIDGKIKIVRNENLGNKAWASNGYNNWNNSDLKSYLNGEYYNGIDITFRNMISEETYYLGGPTDNNIQTLTASGYYNVERSNSVYSGNPTTIEQYIGLMYPSDYGYASGSSCLSTALYRYNSCSNSNYLYNGYSEYGIWLQSPEANYSGGTIIINSSGHVYHDESGLSRGIFPTLYLSSNVQITGGDGSQENPYQLKL